MMRVCHLNTCPVGVASQDPELRRRFNGKPEHVVNYLFMVAEEVREILAELGVREPRASWSAGSTLIEPGEALAHWKSHGVDLSGLLADVAEPGELPRHDPTAVPEREDARPAGPGRRGTRGDPRGRADRDRARHHEPAPRDRRRRLARGRGRPRPGGPARRDDQAPPARRGRARAWAPGSPAGIAIDLRGEANDYVGKGLSGGVLSIRPPEAATYAPEDNVIIGNVALYGATAGRAFFRGRAGERFAVRNSGAKAVVEGVGDHGCEYMTGGMRRRDRPHRATTSPRA